MSRQNGQLREQQGAGTRDSLRPAKFAKLLGVPKTGALAGIIAILGLVGGSWMLHAEHHREVFWESLNTIRVVAPETAPTPNQASLDAAMAIYGIEIPAAVDGPFFEPTLHDRGLTVRGTWTGRSAVFIGPAAFDSWSLLGSTLAHELLVHCQQNFFLISIMDLLRLDGTGAAERQAYEYELAHADQFALSETDRELVAATVAYYYPAANPKQAGGGSGPLAALRIQHWLASQILPAE